MTYSFHDETDLAEARDHARSADRMAGFILVLLVVWLLGAAVMFAAAYKGSTMHVASPTAVDNNASASTGASPAPSDTTPETP
jgi:succinate dehydrogenase hydrophobic anchor subunit